jgi:L1 cell adhesion molecule like protein
VATYLNNNLITITNPNGNRTTPSYIRIDTDNYVFGEIAKIESCKYHKNTFFDIKRVIGKKYTDIEFGSWQFNIENKNNEAIYTTNSNNYTSVELATEIFKYLKSYASEYIGNNITNAVVTIPAHYNDSQRREIRNAAENAGLNVMKLLNEPTAAIIAYDISNKCDIEKTVVVFDCGGGTTDISIATIFDGVIEVIAVGGNSHLGGNDIDTAILKYCIKDIQSKYKNIPSERTIEKLRKQCEQAKKELSVTNEVIICQECVVGENDYLLKLSRSRFEIICSDIFSKCLQCMIDVFNTNNIQKDTITDIIMVGGTTRIPVLRKMISDFFNGKELHTNIDPDEVVAHGAAIHAKSLIDDTKNENSTESLLIDITANSYGIEIYDGKIITIIQKHTKIPCAKKKLFTTYSDNQHTISIKVYENENRFLGMFKLEDLPRGEKGSIHIEVSFEIDIDGVLRVRAFDNTTKKMNDIEIKYN